MEAIYAAEASIIATLLDGPRKLRPLILERVSVDDFISDAAREVFRRIQALLRHGKALPSREVLQVDQALSDEARLFLQRGKIVRKRGDLLLLLENFLRASRAERALDALNDAAKYLKAHDIEEAAAVLTRVRAELQVGDADVLTLDGSPDSVRDTLKTLDAVLQGEAIQLVETGLVEFDRRSGGLPRGGITLIGANTGGGKSTLALCMATNQALKGYKVAYVSLEMDKAELLARMASRLSRIPFDQIYTGRVRPKARELALRKVGQFLRRVHRNGGLLQLYAPDDDSLSMDDICAWARGRQFDVIYIDYVGLLRDLSRQRAKWENLGDAVRNAKLFAGSVKKRKPAMVILVQYDMKKDQVRYSRAMVEHASLCWVWTYGDVERSTHRVKVRQVKTRNQPQYDFWLRENFQFCEMVSVSKEEVDTSLKEDEAPEREKTDAPAPDEPAPPDLDDWVDQLVEEERSNAHASHLRH